jgi:hypothetical protein
MVMMVLALFSWWYTAGWARLAKRVGVRVESVLESFSVALLARTLFDPFRQISAGGVQGPLGVQMRAFGDRLFSRVFGAVVRTLFIFMGIIAALLAALIGLVELLLWPLLPVLPIVGLILSLSGWMP